MNIRVETEAFEGPLDLLVYLIKKREVSIYDIPIAEITEEFLNYIYTMQELNIPLASEFLLMAATLARIKSEYLIPRENSEDPRKELVQIIEEYLKSKKAAKELEKLEDEALKFYPHDPSELIFQFQDKVKIANTAEDLQRALQNILLKNQPTKIKIGIKLSGESFKIPDKMEEIRHLMKDKYLVPFSELVRKSSCRLEIITYFLAILELSKLGEISTFTDGEEIFISKVFRLSPKREVKVIVGQ
ncbi:segregation and condensation protein A [Phorcysia thermohydrogeniphila]|uniref:Segregation and condensation protein A n=1 Tax=Phorcysia thermohydrogeniphila TaxID=936138 RepID=A0A4R1G9V8_9BACT|nr:segregation/condensation protein A [Phorcysia thermohydrogeniphila]TCK03451.1 condensin subunit ScpA [Phorcysia thermohydrogeniphila]